MKTKLPCGHERKIHVCRPKRKVLIIRVELTEGDYDEARQFFSDLEIREILLEDGINELRNKVGMAVAAAQRDGI